MFHCLFVCLFDWLIDWLIDWLTDWSFAVQSLLVFYGLMTIPSASFMRCYVKHCNYFPDGTPYCRGSGAANCSSTEDDRCATLAVSLSSGRSYTIWKCTRSSLNYCNQNVTCQHEKDKAATFWVSVQSCSVTCCDSDECNTPGKKKEVVTFVCCLYAFLSDLIPTSLLKCLLHLGKVWIT